MKSLTTSETVYWVIVLKIQSGREAAFKTVSDKLVESTQTEPGALSYEWSVSEDGGTCHIFERYADSQSVMLHLSRNAELVGQLLKQATMVGFVVYGSPSEELRGHLAGLKPVYLKPLGGFSR